ncbi:MAG TPA: DUF5946 family protein [Terracidiphilus sp.]|jgi:hypothetical protein
MALVQELYDELSLYTLELRDPAFIHQHVVDAYAAQHADANTKPITIVFALMGLYLHLEKGFTGKQVQRAHMRMAQHRKRWVAPPLPQRQALIGVADVLAAAPGAGRNAMIRRWCAAVWKDWDASRGQIASLAQAELDVMP